MTDPLAQLELHHGPGFGDHGTRVASLAVAISRSMGMVEREAGRLRLAALIHDMGKTNVSTDILTKESPLSAEELSSVKQHPAVGHDMFHGAVHRSVSEAILCHHERWDGTGYPNGLKGEQIPLFARVIFVADAYEVMTTGRAYRPRLTVEEAGDELVKATDHQFDSRVVDAFASVDRAML